MLLAIEWKELNINAQMANTMGSTKLVVRDGVLQGFCEVTVPDLLNYYFPTLVCFIHYAVIYKI